MYASEQEFGLIYKFCFAGPLLGPSRENLESPFRDVECDSVWWTQHSFEPSLMLGSRQTPQCWWCTGWHSLRAHQCLLVSACHLVNRKFALWWKSTALERTWRCCNESLWRLHLPKSLPPKYQRWVPGSPTPSCSWSFFFAWDQAHS